MSFSLCDLTFTYVVYFYFNRYTIKGRQVPLPIYFNVFSLIILDLVSVR